MATLEGIKIGNETYDFPKTDAYVKMESDSKYATKTEMSQKQDALTAGDNITIQNGVISASGGGVGDLPITKEVTQEDREEFVCSSDDNSEDYAKIGNYGIKSKAYLDLDGNPIKTAADSLKGKKWVVVGDSFTEGATNHYFDSSYFSKGKAKTYPYYIANRTEINVVSFFGGGRTLAYPSDGSFTNSICCPTSAFYYQNIPADADYITIYLGINDTHHAGIGDDGEDMSGYIYLGTADSTATNTYYGAWNTILTWLRANRPFAHIGIIVTNGATQEYRQASIDMAKKYGYPYLDLNGDEKTPCMIRSVNTNIASAVRLQINKLQAVDYAGGNLHPNDSAHEYESYFIENFLRTI